MLTDAFFRRYEDVQVWSRYGPTEARLLGQLSQLVTLDVHKRNEAEFKERAKDPAVTGLQTAHDRLARELGREQLSPKYWFRKVGLPGALRDEAIAYLIERQLANYLTETCNIDYNADGFIKERISLIELALRVRGEQLFATKFLNVMMVGGQEVWDKLTFDFTNSDRHARTRRLYDAAEAAFNNHVNELNARFQQGGYPLSYHNGFIQLVQDQVVTDRVEKPFWELVANPKWKNADHLVKEAIDKRDRGDRDAVTPAMQALESVIKVISGEKGWDTGNERGAANYINNLVTERDGVRFIEVWEKDALMDLFGQIRNHFGHGPGSDPLPSLLPQQTDWAIDTAMVWIKSLVRRS
ncbi:hypothetical protein IFT54_05635 [Sphingomonas sp. CFBP 13714]|uniref:AbiJ-NTD4 domain-containing protein n=1 Tax=Sphingomonas sp. CFBP 13714 TaxID=2775308 RepID=UPI00177E1B73|nr:hypothetical protein [Sphingomonas sp. CFBP 13714]MBD8699296.1 hypothetical protein [Sphingomonas sp. CFBP 13714]